MFVSVVFNCSTFIIGSVYLPHNSPSLSYEIFMNTVADLISSHISHVFIFCGDYNLPGISWSNDDTVVIYSTKASSQIHCVPETSAVNNFQINNVLNYFGSLLDLIFVSHNQLSVYTLFFLLFLMTTITQH